MVQVRQHRLIPGQCLLAGEMALDDDTTPPFDQLAHRLRHAACGDIAIIEHRPHGVSTRLQPFNLGKALFDPLAQPPKQRVHIAKPGTQRPLHLADSRLVIGRQCFTGKSVSHDIPRSLPFCFRSKD
ncbi:hypothetical protein D3C85_1290170 [compost metagenome]